MRGTDQQAYDRGTTIFSPDGRLYQVEYAREAVTQGAPVVGVRGADAVVLAAHAPRRSPLVVRESVEKLYAVDDHLAVASAGHAADARQLVGVARVAAQRERLRYGEAHAAESLATTVADHVQEQTQTGGTRPYGTALLLAGHDGDPRLFEVDPSGSTGEWTADAVGRGATAALDHLEDASDPDLSTDDALGLALGALEAAADDLGPEAVDAATLDADGFAPVADEQVAGALGAAS